MKKALMLGFVLLLSGHGEENITNTEVEMFNAAGDSLGTIKVEEQASGVKLSGDLSGRRRGNWPYIFMKKQNANPQISNLPGIISILIIRIMGRRIQRAPMRVIFPT